MSAIHHNLSETHIMGSGCRRTSVRANKLDPRPWLNDAPVCQALSQHHIIHAGIADMTAPYRVVRTQQSGAFFMACFGGHGEVLIDGRWRKFPAGYACLLPPSTLNAFHCVKGSRWQFCWVRYLPPPRQKPIVFSDSPVMARFNSEPLRRALEGLHAECLEAPLPSAVHHWVELVQSYVLCFSQPWHGDKRLWQLWSRVEKELDGDWTATRLAKEAHMSFEHLRRLCQKQLGRSPRHQLMHLRMRHAAELLSSSDEKIETIAHAVGYQNAFVFSSTFKKWVGWTPTAFRSSRVTTKQSASSEPSTPSRKPKKQRD